MLFVRFCPHVLALAVVVHIVNTENEAALEDSTLVDDSFAIASIQVGLFDDVVLGVHPVHAVPCIVDGQAIGPEQVCVCNDPPVGAVHIGVLDARCVAPVGPVDLTVKESHVSLFDYTSANGDI